MGPCLTGCKYSDVLTEHIEDPVNGVLDENAEPLYKDVPGAPYDPTRSSQIEPDVERVDEQEEDRPDYDEDAQGDEQTSERIQQQQSTRRSNATSGLLMSSRVGSNESAGAGDATTDAGAGDAGAGDGEGSTSEEQDHAGDSFDDGMANAGAGGTGQRYDASGTNVQLPSGVGSVAAAGQYATIVQMLAGRGALVAADGAWIDDALSRGFFPDEGLDGLTRAWDGDGSLDLEALIAADPDVLLADAATVSLSEGQLQALEDAQIDVVTVPTLGRTDTSDADIVAAVTVVGELLKSAPSQYDPSAMVTLYRQQHDEAISNCLSANGGYTFKMMHGTAYTGIYQGTSLNGDETTYLSGNRYTTAFINSWTYGIAGSSVAQRSYSNATLYLHGAEIDSTDGAGLSASGTSQSFQLIDYYLQVSGVVNNAYEGAKPSISGGGEIESPYLIAAGETRDLVAGGITVSSRAVPSALWYSPSSIALGTEWVTAGDGSYPCVLARTEELAANVVASASKANGLYNVGQPYGVRVVPVGFEGSWADGTIESFLLAPWAYCVFQQGGDMEAARGYADAFYQTFYRVGGSQADDFDFELVAPCPQG